jgi:hypothetical protein
MTEERDLARLFQERRRAEEASAPPWNEVRARRATPRPIRWYFPVLRLSAVAVLLGAAAVMSIRLRQGGTRRRAPEHESATIAAWSSPTAWLLETPGRELRSEVPVLVEAPADPVRAATTPTKGDRP